MESTSLDREKILEEYRSYCKKMPKSYYEYESAQIHFNDCERYELQKTMGRGKYSEVYLGQDRQTDQLVVVKLLKPVRKAKISREIRILQEMKGGPFIVELLDVCIDHMSKTPALVFKHESPVSMKHVMHDLSPVDVSYYMYQILLALDYCHSRGIMHRDVKPNNIIIDQNKKELRLIDWGLSEFYIHEKEYNTRVSSRPYKSPELLTGHMLYDFSMDIWSLGCMLGAIIFKKEHMFLGKDNPDQLVKIVGVMGSNDFFAFVDKFDIDIDNHDQTLLKNRKRKPWTSFIKDKNREFCSEEALDLLAQMLVYDHSTRITAREAMAHPYFNSVRHLYNK